MVVVLKKGASKKEIESVEDAIYEPGAKKGFDAKKYNGVLTLNDDALDIQLKLRNEWERDLS